MLQIATGKLFSRPVGWENLLRGILYTNATFGDQDAIETAVGRLLPSTSHSIHPRVLVYELLERMEAEESGPGVLISSCVEPYLNDFAVVASFTLNCVCTPDIDLARRLMSGKKGLATRAAPQELVRRFFDTDLWCKPEEITFLQEFTGQLIDLPRNTFLCVMRAIRTYINGMHRIADDLELAYTLLVASVESLAQDFDGHESDWESYEERKRLAVDEALSGAEEELTQRVREALLRVEHTALARRFREFAISHTPPSYFREPALAMNQSLARSDLKEVLAMAYQSRSKYVHQLKRLPDVVVLGYGFGETALHERATFLTLQGLSRLMRNVIIEFVKGQPSLTHEEYDYVLERSGVIKMQMAPQYWVGNAEGDLINAGRRKLEGFLEQYVPCILKEEGATLTDLRPVLSAVAELLPDSKKAPRLPYLALYVLFNAVVSEEQRAPISESINRLIQQELSQPSTETLIVCAILGKMINWPLETHHQELENYFKRRRSPSGLRFPRLFEAAMSLDLAERYRLLSNVNKCREMVALAVESHPGHHQLVQMEAEITLDTPILWADVLIPRSTSGDDAE
ncbi:MULTISPECIES: hypothetical protein [Pseudomonas]|uniref:hypothetical protein n=1 Tax=Pseudomonas TaxID=286 RepID=UPI000C21F666|nr:MULTISPECIES: hypothetical protein [Pseudomonas]PJH88533.1 hypothetical protein CVG87_12690 [Pseudomonas sp. WCS365]UII13509.1 hypothetical protein LRP86_00364 [Pseudomonas brassicacearum]